MSMLSLILVCFLPVAMICVVLYPIDKHEKRFNPPRGKPGLPAWHRETAQTDGVANGKLLAEHEDLHEVRR